jgi:hypothetical protein|eukprot:SAG25_NODE_619_length_6424_cov_11.572174_6_plen_36_part_00
MPELNGKVASTALPWRGHDGAHYAANIIAAMAGPV